MVVRKAPSATLNSRGNCNLGFTQNIEVPPCLYDTAEQVPAYFPADLMFQTSASGSFSQTQNVWQCWKCPESTESTSSGEAPEGVFVDSQGCVEQVWRQPWRGCGGDSAREDRVPELGFLQPAAAVEKMQW